MTAGPAAAWDEIGFLAFELGCDRRAATRAWLEEAGLWEEHFQPHLHSNEAHDADGPGEPRENNLPVDSIAADATEASLPKVTNAKSPLIVFYEALELSDADREELKLKRGLSDEIIDAAGLRTNCHANLELLHNAGSSTFAFRA